MTSSRKIITLLSFFLILSTNIITAQCNYTVNTSFGASNYVTFSQSGGWGSTYIYDYGDGSADTSSFNTSFQHAYTSSGTYYFCLTIDNCPPVCDTIVIDICNYNVSANINTHNGAEAHFFIPPPYLLGLQFIWDFGDGTTDTTNQFHPATYHTYQSSGTYYYCLNVGGCPPVCDSITINVCNYSINTSQDTINGVIETTFYTYGSGTSYFWDFGDGNTSTLQSPTHIYSTPGTYYYCLTIDSCPPVCDSIVIPDLCAYTINNVNYSGIPTDPITFYTNSSYGSSYFWDFGDGVTSTLQSPQHTYSNPGTYYYCLTMDSCPPVCDSIVVDFCNFSMSISSLNSNTFNFSTSIDTSSSSLIWNFGDGNTSTQQNSQHTYANSGTYYYCLTVDSCPAICDSVTVVNPCDSVNASFTISQPINTNLSHYSFSSTSTGNIASYFWDFGDGNTSTYYLGSNLYISGGTYYPSLTIIDSNGCSSTVIDTIVFNVCNYSASASNTFNFNTKNFRTNYNYGLNYFWDFGDGVTSTQQYPQHTYSNSGTYYYCATIDSCPPVCDSIVIPPLCNYTVSDSANTFSGNSQLISFYSNVSGSNYFWDFGDGITSTQQYSQHTYSNSGTYYYCLTVDSCPPVCDSIVIDYCNYTISVSGSFYNGYNFLTNTNSTNLLWDFGDGNTSAQQSPLHYYALPGTYYYCLTADSCPTICDSITVLSPPCNVTASFNFVDNGFGDYTFTSTSTGNNYVLWDFGDNSGNNIDNVVNHTYITNGTYGISLIVGDSNNSTCTDTAYQTITVTSGSACSIVAGFTYIDNGNGNYTFTDTSIGSINSYSWHFGDGYSSSSMNPNHTFTANGLYTVVLYASLIDSNLNYSVCNDYATITINVTGVPNPVTCQAGFVIYTDSILFNGVFVTNSSTGNNLSYFWDFGDGNTSTQAYPFHFYGNSGPYYLCLTIDDGNGCTSTYCDSINSGGIVLKQAGFTINIISPTATAIEENVEQISALNIYPNPFKDNLSIDFNLNEQAQVAIFVSDLLGNTIDQISTEELTVGNNHLIWNAKKLSNGIYLLHIKTNNSMQVKKLVLNR